VPDAGHTQIASSAAPPDANATLFFAQVTLGALKPAFGLASTFIHAEVVQNNVARGNDVY
jgi:hypothetical protein